MSANIRQFVPDQKQRIAAIRDVVYEYANLLTAGYWSIHGQPPWRTHCDDAFLLGCRKLDDFLMQGKRSARGGHELDDVLSLDYMPPGRPRIWDLPVWIAEWRDPMNKQLAHIAYCRDKEWDHLRWIPMLEPEFREAWWDFREAIVDDEYSREFDAQLTARQRKMGFGNMFLRSW